MVDVVQIVLLLVIVVLTVLLLVLGIQVFYILREMRKAVMKANRVLDNTNSITESVSQPISALSSIVSGLTAGTVVSKLLKIGLRAVTGDKKKGDIDGE